MELAIDTSTNYASIAISDQGETLSEFSWHTKQNHTRELVPNIDYILKQSNQEPQAINAVFIAKGPGSFNGLRVGMSTAKGFSFALNIPIVAIGTLEIEAYPFAFTRLPLCPVHNAGRGEIATALYQQSELWSCLKPEHITTVTELCGEIKERTLFCGEIPEEAIEQFSAELGEKAIIPEQVARIRHARYLSMLGWQRLNQGESDDPTSLQPIYLRPPPITQRKVK
jgi:tRNA threonylcarbamoyl adenosine modification protein YeaZ